MKKIHLLLSFLLLISCSEENDLRQEQVTGPQINIYLTAPDNSSFYDQRENLDAIETDKEPWLNHSEILFYDWSSHMFFLKNEKEKGKYAGRNFVVKAGEKPLFAGVFFSMYMSSFPQIPSIIAQDGLFEPKDVVSFGQFGYVHSGQMNEQQDFKEALIETGFLKNGIEVKLEKVRKLSATKLDYTFRVTNKDLENIYVPDPKKMGSKRFHYYTNGVSVQDGATYYYPDIESIASEKIEDNWYFKLHPGESMRRTVALDGFHNLPSGTVSCKFVFPGGKVDAGEWLKPDGRIWLGNYLTEEELSLH